MQMFHFFVKAFSRRNGGKIEDPSELPRIEPRTSRRLVLWILVRLS